MQMLQSITIHTSLNTALYEASLSPYIQNTGIIRLLQTAKEQMREGCLPIS